SVLSEIKTQVMPEQHNPYENIIRNISRHIALTNDEKQLFTGLLQEQQIPKKTILLSEGEICQHEGYIEQGCVRVYYLNENGFEVTLSFAVEDWWVSDIASFQDQKPSRLYIETLEDTKLYVLTPCTKEELLQRIPKFERVFRLLVQRNLSSLQNRLI